MTVGDLREIINDPDIPDDAPVWVHTTIQGKVSSWDWELIGAHGTLAGEGKRLTLQLEGHFGP